MNLSEANQKNLAYMLDSIGKQLDVANPSLLDPEDYNIDKYDDLKWLYDFVVNKNNISIAEKEAFIEELATIRK
ncbi:MAG: DUF1128 domain-containing protein [Amphibacillus sp.]|uniref:Uncharacterized protein n=1 Tax=Amphibacillus xylanus (strain ATCC 51415 / DSM 6626 / JCM 7361 / LMG 17667 / NBRC 15112 / Ep01) TaxID=698758 RepID=K0J4K2_AMPXN|nr:DUF1128 domain-containing protein [Amphibacillus xylanus]NMA91290.1 DUF1128 domain-containing protein [Amphibacillus sp.]BAM47661.1 hypothetical protein AXY_15290 [Amphibacillus xylanus NBRC 15112]